MIYTFSRFIILFSFLFAFSNNDLNKNNNYSTINYNSESINIKEVDGKKHIVDNSQKINDLSYYPTQTTFYQIKDGKDISASYIVHGSHYEENMHIDQSILDIDNEEYYPKENIVLSDIMVFRGVVIRQLTFYPFKINLETGEMEVFDNVEINIEEYGVDEPRNYHRTKLSKAFEPLYESMIYNYESSSRDEDYQVPSVLYICGGSSLNNSYVQDLIEWRHRTGFVVHVATTTNDGDGLNGSSTSTVKNYIENLYENSENPPEIVALIGDTGGSYSIGYYTESWSGYNGAGDMPYSLLDGNDLLPEIFIGRISVNSSNDLSNVINKTLVYEKATYLTQISTDWYERAALCGDPSSSGWSTVISNEYIGNIMNAYGFEDVNGNYGNGGYSNWMENELEDGCLYMNYRGYYGSSGFGSNNINNANNGYQNPFAVFITCGTGDYNSTSLSENLFRAGSVSSPKGAVAAIGTATTGTHTLFNNIVDMGIFDGIFPKNLRSAGGAMANGRLSLLWTYPSDPSNYVSIFSHWNNLIGDPALQLWTDTPKIINAEFNENIPFGTNFIEVNITDDNGLAVEGASITLLKGEDEIFKTVLTDINGEATIDLEYNSSGEVLLTVTKQNCKPVVESFDIISSGVLVNVDHSNIFIVDDNDEFTSGNDDGYLNPGETIKLYIPLQNLGNESSFGVVANLTTDSELVSIINNFNQYGDLVPNDSSEGFYYYLLQLSSNVTTQDNLGLKLTINDESSNQWESMIDLDMKAGYLLVDHIQLINNIELEPNEQSEIQIFLTNEGEYPLYDVQLNLIPYGYIVEILNGETSFGTINPNETVGSILSSSISVFINENTINGTVVNMDAALSSSNGYDEITDFDIYIGHVTQMDPLGPDEYGYYIYDSGDLGYSLAPFYDWIEIDNDYFGPGVELNMNDSGDGNNISTSSVVVDLPFPFTFYGITYNEITINTNGWISFGESILESFRNYPIPGAGGPSPMLAAFWDDLKTTSNAEIYIHESDSQFIIEWSEMRTYNNNDVETFQIILYGDSVTPTGDNEIKIQYKTFNNTSQGSYNWGGTHGGYSTIGIENQLSDIGLQYTFNNEYPTAAMPLSNETAIFITTRTPVAILNGDVNQDSSVDVIDIVLIVNHILDSQNESLDPLGVYVADMNEDGSINVLDIIMVVLVILDNN